MDKIQNTWKNIHNDKLFCILFHVYCMFVLINKPLGWTSFDVVAYIRQQIYTQEKKVGLPAEARRRAKVGHAGTLDPFATGLLIVGVGREATKRLDEFQKLPKTYVATLKLGYVSDTFDKTGTITKYEKNISKILSKYDNKFISYFIRIFCKQINLTLENINLVLKKFTGKQKQLPPMFSAKKVKGQRLYKLARKGITIKRKKNNIEIFAIKILAYNYPLLKIEINCSSGTYIRSLANDIGKKLGVGAYCEELERTAIGEYKLADATLPDHLTT